MCKGAKKGAYLNMRRSYRSGNFFLCLLINMVLNFEWSIPAWVLLALHFWLDISVWWFIGALALWVIRILFGMWLIRWARACGSIKDPLKENKNPYSKKR